MRNGFVYDPLSIVVHLFVGPAEHFRNILQLGIADLINAVLGRYCQNRKNGFYPVDVLFGKFPHVYADSGSFHKIFPVGYIVSELDYDAGGPFGNAPGRHVQILSVYHLRKHVGVDCRKGVS